MGQRAGSHRSRGAGKRCEDGTQAKVAISAEGHGEIIRTGGSVAGVGVAAEGEGIRPYKRLTCTVTVEERPVILSVEERPVILSVEERAIGISIQERECITSFQEREVKLEVEE